MNNWLLKEDVEHREGEGVEQHYRAFNSGLVLAPD